MTWKERGWGSLSNTAKFTPEVLGRASPGWWKCRSWILTSPLWTQINSKLVASTWRSRLEPSSTKFAGRDLTLLVHDGTPTAATTNTTAVTATSVTFFEALPLTPLCLPFLLFFVRRQPT